MRVLTVLAAVAWLIGASPAGAQINTQLWGNLTLDWLKSPRLTLELDIEPKVLLTKPPDDPGWANIDLTPNAEYAWKPWLDLVGEATVGVTQQTDDVRTVEVSPRVGARFHLFSRDLITLGPRHELMPRRRLMVRDLVRVEWRNMFNSGTQPDEFSARFRNRLELQLAINRPTMTEDGVRYLLVDWEWFFPMTDVEERFANRQRVRTGLGSTWPTRTRSHMRSGPASGCRRKPSGSLPRAAV